MGYCRLSAHEFWHMTIREVRWRIEEEQKRENRALERLGDQAVWLINATREARYHIKRSDLIVRRLTRQQEADD